MKNKGSEIGSILVIAIILGITISYGKAPIDYIVGILSCIIIILTNSITKYLTANHYDADITIKPWSIYQYGFRREAHFKSPVTMAWLPLLISLISQGTIWWLAALQFNTKPRPERVAKRHNTRHRYSEITEEHVGKIAFMGIISYIVLAIITWAIGFKDLAQLTILFSAWSLIPISNLDGTKILFGNKFIWLMSVIITIISAAIVFQY